MGRNGVRRHPAPGEEIEAAIVRRLDNELGMTAHDFKVILPTYTYKTTPYNGIVDHEFCPVYFAKSNDTPQPNPDEVAEYKWMEWDDFVTTASADTDDIWSWWSKDQIKQLKDKV